ncbi:MFS transporter [Sulfolobus tengchongensis]|uniref:MFS transporter n=1 Tax=Sulfolobus tengchongensis TaxID=207809 RepID=A0AAX4L1Q2_9CREN
MSKGRRDEIEINTRERIKVAIAAMVGSIVDWYDFFLAATVSAIVWPVIFFNYLAGPAALAASVITYIAGYFTRPIGAFVFGNYGDMLGRKVMLIVTLILTGGSLIGIGLTPGYAQIGILAPALILLFRLIYGFGMGGEYGGAQTIITEFSANTKWRGLWNSIVGSSLPIGNALAPLAFLVLLDTYGIKEFIAFAWRIGFYFGAVVLIVGIGLRYMISETPLFTRLKQEGRIEKSPAIKLFRKYWKILLPACFLNAPLIAVALSEAGGPIPIAFVQALKLPIQDILLAQFVGYIIGAIFTILSGLASDYIGRKTMLLLSLVTSVAISYPAWLLLRSGSLPLMILEQVLVVVFSVSLGTTSALTAFYMEIFPTRYRYSGGGFAFQVASLIGSAIAGVLYPIFLVTYKGPLNAWPIIALGNVILGIIGIIVVVTLIIETRGKQLED